MPETDLFEALSEDELEAVSSATALVVASLQDAVRDNSYSPVEKALYVAHGADLISAYLEVHMHIERSVAVATAINLLEDLVEDGTLK